MTKIWMQVSVEMKTNPKRETVTPLNDFTTLLVLRCVGGIANCQSTARRCSFEAMDSAQRRRRTIKPNLVLNMAGIRSYGVRC